MKNFFILLTLLFLSQHLMSQKVWIEGYYIFDSKTIYYNGDSATAFYQLKNVVFVDRNKRPEYYRGLPDSLPPLPDGRYLLFAVDSLHTDTTLFHEWYMKNGKRDSIRIIYHENGAPYKIEEFKNGVREGKQLILDDSGNTQFYWTIKNGLVDGECFYFNENEMLFSRGAFHNGERVGKWTHSSFPDALTGFYIQEEIDTIHHKSIRKCYINDSLTQVDIHTKHRSITYIDGKRIRPEKHKKIKPKEPKIIVFKGIRFCNDLSDIDTTSFTAFDDVIDQLKQSPDLKIQLHFYSAYPQENPVPKWISVVVKYFIARGIDASRIYPRFYSDRVPLINAKKTERMKNEKKKAKLIKKNQRIAYSLIE